MTIETIPNTGNEFEKLLAVIPDSVIVHHQGTLLYANKEAASAFAGIPASEVRGKNISIFLSKIYTSQGPGSVDWLKLSQMEGERELNLVRLTGELRRCLVRIRPILFEEKNCHVVIIIDITERKAAEEKLKEREEEYKSLMERLPIGVYRTLENGTILHANPALAKIFGFDSIDELKKKLSSTQVYNQPGERARVLEEWRHSNGISTSETEFTTFDGRKIWVLDRGNVLLDEKGNIVQIDGIIQDITERKNAEKEIIKAKEKAEEASRVKTNFLASMSHELRTPLHGILGFTELLQKELSDSKYADWFSLLHISGKRLSETLDLILQFAKLEAEKVEPHLGEIDIAPLVQEVLSMMTPFADQKKIYLASRIKNPGIKIKTDERLVREILTNLVNNAIKFTRTGSVTVESSVGSGKLMIRVKDTGIGIARNKLDEIFQEFRQESEGHGRNFEGVGLGLTITKRFVELLKGTIAVESEPGVGSVFTVNIPVESDELSDSGEQSATGLIQDFDSEKKKGRPKVLIVEDDEINRKVMSAIISEFYDVDCVSEGISALRQADSNHYDLIIMDINLGAGMNGLEVTEKIRKMDGYGFVPVIAVTAFVFPGDKEEFLERGCTHYLAKPFNKKDLTTLVTNILTD